MACPTLMFYLSLHLNRWKLDIIQDRSYRTFANQIPVFTTLSHLREIPLLSLGWDVPLPFQDLFYAPKIMFIYKCWPTSYEINKVTPSYSTSHIPPSTYTYAYVLQQVEDGCSKWKKTLAYLLVLPGSRARIVRCGGRYDPQLVKRSSEWVFVCLFVIVFVLD